jgi:hypothetical protein
MPPAKDMLGQASKQHSGMTQGVNCRMSIGDFEMRMPPEAGVQIKKQKVNGKNCGIAALRKNLCFRREKVQSSQRKHLDVNSISYLVFSIASRLRRIKFGISCERLNTND